MRRRHLGGKDRHVALSAVESGEMGRPVEENAEKPK